MTRGRTPPQSRNAEYVVMALRTGTMPESGGLLAQSNDFIEDLQTVLNEIAEIERETKEQYG